MSRVLVIDDHDPSRNNLLSVLRTNGYEVQDNRGHRPSFGLYNLPVILAQQMGIGSTNNWAIMSGRAKLDRSKEVSS